MLCSNVSTVDLEQVKGYDLYFTNNIPYNFQKDPARAVHNDVKLSFLYTYFLKFLFSITNRTNKKYNIS